MKNLTTSRYADSADLYWHHPDVSPGATVVLTIVTNELRTRLTHKIDTVATYGGFTDVYVDRSTEHGFRSFRIQH